MNRYNNRVNTKQSLLECSEYSGPISSILHNNFHIEAELCNFYAIILQKLYENFQTEYGHLCKALHNIRAIREPGKSPRLPDYEGNDSRYAYIFSFSIIHSVLMYDKFRDMMKKNPPMLKKIFSMRELNICILGAGPGFEAVAICKFLKKAIEILKPETISQLLIRITVVDMCVEWKTMIECLFTTLQNDLHPVIEVDYSFVHADLTQELPPVVIRAIENSYIVIMFKFVYEVFNRYGTGNVEKMIKGIIEVMSFESCLFFLDNAGGRIFRIVDEMINNIPHTKRFYGPKLHHCQELKEETVEKYTFFVQDIFKALKCTRKTTISCSAWFKINRIELDIDKSSVTKNKNFNETLEKGKQRGEEIAKENFKE